MLTVKYPHPDPGQPWNCCTPNSPLAFTKAVVLNLGVGKAVSGGSWEISSFKRLYTG